MEIIAIYIGIINMILGGVITTGFLIYGVMHLLNLLIKKYTRARMVFGVWDKLDEYKRVEIYRILYKEEGETK